MIELDVSIQFCNFDYVKPDSAARVRMPLEVIQRRRAKFPLFTGRYSRSRAAKFQATPCFYFHKSQYLTLSRYNIQFSKQAGKISIQDFVALLL